MSTPLFLDPTARAVFATNVVITALNGAWRQNDPVWRELNRLLNHGNMRPAALLLRSARCMWRKERCAGKTRDAFALVDLLHRVLLVPRNQATFNATLAAATAFVRDHRGGAHRMEDWESWLHAYRRATHYEMLTRLCTPEFSS